VRGQVNRREIRDFCATSLMLGGGIAARTAIRKYVNDHDHSQDERSAIVASVTTTSKIPRMS
jgi:hypothetical protein